MAVAAGYLRAMAGAGASDAAQALGSVWKQPYLAGSFLLAAGVAAWGVQTWDWTQKMSLPKACAILGIGVLALVALLTQDYNPFIYFIF